MNYEKKYKEALEIAQKLYQDCPNGKNDRLYHTTDLEKMFPELRESEDEKIRKELIEHIKDQQSSFISAPDCRDKYEEEENNKYNSWIAWLEKQGDKDKLIKELGEYKAKYTQEVLEKHLNNMSNKDNERLRKTTISFLKEFADKGYENAVECIDWLEKQGEQKPIIEMITPEESLGIDSETYNEIVNACIFGENKPKFKVGDTIKKESTGDIVTISEIDLKNREYRLSNTGFIPFKYEHLWELVEQKPAWSEGDETLLSSVINSLLIFEDSGASKMKIDWLISIKQRIGG